MATQIVDAGPILCSPICERLSQRKPAFLEFFAGSGLVSYALGKYFRTVWANDISYKKADVYVANHGPEHFRLCPIEEIHGTDLPPAALSWASFPCQDLSLAGLTAGINGHRSGLVWHWLRIMREMRNTPPVLVAENVVGLVSAHGGKHYQDLHKALRKLGYLAGAVVLDAARWLPQSRPRVFVIAVRQDLSIPHDLLTKQPTWLHPSAVQRAAQGLEGWIWWNMPEPATRRKKLKDIIEWDAACADGVNERRNLRLIAPHHYRKLKEHDIIVAPGYKRTRARGQVLELRFDGVAGCLRTPEGGSSRQFLVLKNGDEIRVRLLTVRETARLMGAPESYRLPGSYNDGYKAMGDAVAVPVARYLARHLLKPLIGTPE